MTLQTYLKAIEQEETIRLEGRKKVDPHAYALWDAALARVINQQQKDILLKAYDFGKNIKYQHGGLDSDIYFAHPVRVAALALLSQPVENIEVGIIGLLHNVFELSPTEPKIIEDLFGAQIRIQIEHLTVDRDLQWDEEYKSAYYQVITNDPLSSRVVKIIDKLDNLFILNINPDKVIKIKYLTEIEKYILPMVQKDMPEIYEYFQRLISEVSQKLN